MGVVGGGSLGGVAAAPLSSERKLSLPPALPALAETDAPCGSPCGLSASAKWVLKPSMMGLPVMHSCSPEPGPALPPTHTAASSAGQQDQGSSGSPKTARGVAWLRGVAAWLGLGSCMTTQRGGVYTDLQLLTRHAGQTTRLGVFDSRRLTDKLRQKMEH